METDCKMCNICAAERDVLNFRIVGNLAWKISLVRPNCCSEKLQPQISQRTENFGGDAAMHIYHLSMTLVNCCEVEEVSNKENCYLRVFQTSAPKNGPHVTLRTCFGDQGSPVTSGHLSASKPLESSCQTVEKLKATPAFDRDTAISLFMENISRSF